MKGKNNIDAFYERLGNIDVLNKDFNKDIQHVYSDFFKYDRSLVSGEPNEIDLEEDVVELKDGRVRFYHKGVCFEAFFKSGRDQNCLVVTFAGARNKGESLKFRRWSWSPFIDGHLLCFDDPMFNQFQDLTLGWFYGTEDEDYAIYAAEIIKKVAIGLGIHNNSNIVLYSSSGGRQQLFA